jgi:hypothetical protein
MSITIVGGGNPSGPTFPIQRSVRLRSSASAYFNRTPSVAATSNQKMTYSAWVKRGQLGVATAGALLSSGTQLVNDDIIRFATDNLQLWFNAAASYYLITTQVFRDPSAWYHIVISIDTTQATAANRVIFYINGVQVTAFSTANYPPQNYTFGQFNQNGAGQRIGLYSSTYFDGYLAEVNVIDGQALTPTSFGAYNSYGVWSPSKYTGSYGTNGFYLNFQDNSAATATTIGKDSSGNGNNWTPNNISVTAGVTYDSMLDVPTNTSPTNANFAVLNPLSTAASTLVANGNLSGSNVTTNNYSSFIGSMAMTSGKWYFEGTTVGTAPTAMCGIGVTTLEYYAGTSAAYATTYQSPPFSNLFTAGTVSGTVVAAAFDADAGTCQFYTNGVASGSPVTGLTGGRYPMFVVSYYPSTQVLHANFGQRPFSYTPPTGFKSLNTYNLPAPTIANGAAYMAATLWTGTGAALSVANTVNDVSFQPDFVWLKTRSTISSNLLYDSVRGALNYLSSNQTAAEAALANSLTGFNSNGFALGSDSNVNGSGTTFVGWQWKANGTPAVTNTSGSIPSTISANTTAGFSIVTYTGTGANATVGHGLGVAPKMVITKSRSGTSDWNTYHASANASPATGLVFLNSTSAFTTFATAWNNTAPTSTTFSLGTYAGVNNSGTTYVAYAFSEIAGYSKFGSYTGNGSADGPFVYTGFRPRWVMVKSSSIGGAGYSWFILDSSRNTYNVMGNYLLAQATDAEAVTNVIDFLSNGFKLRFGGGGVNPSGATMIYMAFAENPFNYSLAR